MSGGTPQARIVADGRVHITNRVYWEGIDPWQPQPRRRQAAARVPLTEQRSRRHLLCLLTSR